MQKPSSPWKRLELGASSKLIKGQGRLRAFMGTRRMAFLRLNGTSQDQLHLGKLRPRFWPTRTVGIHCTFLRQASLRAAGSVLEAVDLVCDEDAGWLPTTGSCRLAHSDLLFAVGTHSRLTTVITHNLRRLLSRSEGGPHQLKVALISRLEGAPNSRSRCSFSFSFF